MTITGPTARTGGRADSKTDYENDSIFTRLRRTLSLALTALIAATMMACEGDDKMLTELPKPDDGNGNGTTEITPDKGITLYGLVSDKEGNPSKGSS